MDMEEAVPIFWDQVIPPGKMPLKFDEGFNLLISNSSLENVEGQDTKICRLFGEITIPVDSYDDNNDAAGEPLVQKVLLSSLISNKKETETLEYFFSPINIVTLENTSEFTFHLTGSLQPIPDLDIDDLDEEEDEEEEINENNDSKHENLGKTKKYNNKGNEEDREEIDVDEIQSKVKEFMKKSTHK